ncbi:D-alanyl-D-alanine carboxypeptidase [Candidatus Pelagibacter sp. IMCC9063]|mgnify:FL=1|uniref:D-alanyl-D-alanine carboxypeptidase family protein n=1 Tax=Pelagibacter sp. (strain IMCC9063) TaxID=1002672 RepID=UPI000204681C|nr:serine hydrolase [Candidatus Pelagibacter sp. IMCC9063]AEA81586.1 D-alanyl-D-alanine carboxypeptidase [Candidatus Pelagibacter sp. IMCC9063]|tara:strand:+ start:733 stop:1872 length:1140 start_codon:yes stop_codon:yes gene_type:complete
MKKITILLISFFLIQAYNANALITSAKQAILMDVNSGQVLFKKNENEKISPASITKVMTSIIAFDLIKSGELKLNEKFLVSNKAWRMAKQGYSSMFIVPNDRITVLNLLKGIIIASGNDACIALAEGIAGSEAAFASMMNDKAKSIGMTNTNFSNSSGIYSEDNYSTVSDISLMSVYLIKEFPELYKMYAERTFTWDRTGGNPITQSNRNTLLYKNSKVDGIKTGHLNDSGYSLAATMLVNNRRILSVVSGTNSQKERAKESLKLLNHAIITTELLLVKKENPLFSINTWNGKKSSIKLELEKDLYITYSKRRSRDIKMYLEVSEPIKDHFKASDQLGVLRIKDKNGLDIKQPLFATEDFKKINFIKRFFNSIGFLVWG